ncbi:MULTISPECIES: hypothetical protein [unclassified Tolypothrix]|uniref:hypothetical protein n=1 Tax=unclassified Tolypothrix TaxID=2649714 RepID=UPI0005EAB901|nr:MULTISPECIES: hypothetical protein [unclassified Tolypothrix]BAY93658.1 hypothetical protein NIES3275_57000 [Microchaete diplosiphon NIES-3275]EKE99540.1 hypothetical protein FDUTEX481_09800 [Tolypothrix sp. PCC 7601]MBE9081711.1 hypothetical protein [Tolypothrix sp. LEGE 11397]UYD27478.1 hypothetical protein HGR01_05155 [Tolypothrix sp. PCC 7712]UYD36658.1 hypothetical protein HG267_13555 [Tolypothrix sp. PCC 7601]
MSKQIDFRWRYQPRKQMDMQLMEYIQDNQITSKTEMILLALRSFWLPYAIAEDSLPQEQMRRVARASVQALRKQIKEILELAGLEDTSLDVQLQLTQLRSLQVANVIATHGANTSIDELRTHAGNHAYDDTGLSNFL